MEEIFESAVNSSETFAGVFECDDETGYFYLYQMDADEGNKIICSIRIVAGKPTFTEQDIAVKWNSTEQFVGLFIKDILWATFNCNSGEKFGGDYHLDGSPAISKEIENQFY